MSKIYKKTYEDPIKLQNKNFQKIISFYLFECPVKNTSQRGKTFKDYGWEGQTFATLKKNMFSSAHSSLRKNYFPCTKSELQEKFNQVSKVSPCDEYCVFLIHDNHIMQSLFSAIRNSFAHGSFSVRTYTVNKEKHRIYFMANFKDYLKAEIVLREETLLSWIRIVQKQ